MEDMRFMKAKFLSFSFLSLLLYFLLLWPFYITTNIRINDIKDNLKSIGKYAFKTSLIYSYDLDTLNLDQDLLKIILKTKIKEIENDSEKYIFGININDEITRINYMISINNEIVDTFTQTLKYEEI